MNNVDCEALLKQGVICAKKQITAYCTTDLSIFKENERNRALNKAKLQNFVYQFKHGNFLDEIPVVVLPDFRLADGHHRIAAMKKLLTQEDCPVKSFPVWFVITENEDYLHISNTCGSSWKDQDHIKFYVDEGNPHYVYLEKSIQKVRDQQNKMHIECKIDKSAIKSVLRGFTAGTIKSRALTDSGNEEISNGGLKIRVKVEYILDILPYYKEIQVDSGYRTILKGTSTKAAFLTLLVILNAFECDMDYVVEVILNIKNKNNVFNSAVSSGGVKELIFNKLGQRFKKQLLKKINLPTFNDVADLTFYKVMYAYTRKVHNKCFIPEGVYKQEEIMNRMEQEELMNQKQ